MKNITLAFSIFCLSSCTTQDSANLKRVAVAGGVGYLTGGQAGAITAAAAELGKTSAKSPRNIQP